MTRTEFDQQLARLSVLKGVPSEVAGFWDALQDLPDDVFPGAVTHALRTRVWFPTPAELRADADHVAASRPLPVDDRVRERPLEEAVSVTLPTGRRFPIDREWVYDCEVCRDSGWDERTCYPEHGPNCGRREPHDEHTFVVPCACIPTNRTIQRRKAAWLKYAKAPETVPA